MRWVLYQSLLDLFTETSRRNLHVTGWMNLRKSFRGADASVLLSLAQLQSCHYQGPATPRTLALIITGLLLLHVVQTKRKGIFKEKRAVSFCSHSHVGQHQFSNLAIVKENISKFKNKLQRPHQWQWKFGVMSPVKCHFLFVIFILIFWLPYY